MKNIPEGYKETELGIIPKEWEVKKLGEVASLITKGTTPSSVGFSFVSEGINFIKVENISLTGKIKITETTKITTDCNEKLKRSIIEENDILVSIAGTIGRTAKIKKEYLPANTNQAVAIIRISNNNFINISYLNYTFLSEYFISYIKSIKTIGAQPNMSLKQLGEYLFLFPPLPEQEKIAEILSSFDEHIEKLDDTIKEYELLKKGMMKKLLTKGINHTEFKETELGIIPKDWEVKKLEESTKYVDYRGKTPQKSEHGVFLVTAKNIKMGFIDYNCSKEYVLLSEYENIMRRGKPQFGDVVFTTEAPCGNVAQIDKIDIALAQRVIKFSGKKNYLFNTFLKYYLCGANFQNRLSFLVTGGTVKGIKGSILHKMTIPVPPLPEQEKIAEILSSIDERIDLFTTQKEEFVKIKKGLMEKLLTGKIRVNELY